MIYEEQAKQIEEYIEKNSVFIDDKTLLRIREHQPDIDLYRPILEHADKLYINGKHLLKEFQFSEALKQLLEAEKIFQKHLSFRDLVVQKLVKIYEHVAFIYLCSNDFFNALTMWRRAINIRMSFNYL
jgi:tetratricopeptide (TPR) repeat protein